LFIKAGTFCNIWLWQALFQMVDAWWPAHLLIQIVNNLIADYLIIKETAGY
jgi:hypothetical protein